jgi:hypothetical protein
VTRRQIGRTSLQVDALGFGAAQIGNLYRVVEDGTATEVVDAAWEAGVRTAAQASSNAGFMRADIPGAVWPRLDEVLAAPLGTG